MKVEKGLFAELTGGLVKRVGELHRGMENAVAELNVLRGCLRIELANLRGEVAELREVVQEALQGPQTQSWCRVHEQYEPGVAYHEEPDYMIEDMKSPARHGDSEKKPKRKKKGV